jgi:general secretion pathway protein D
MCLISLSFSGCTREAKETSLMPHQGNQEFVRSGSPVGAVGGKASSDSAAITSQEQTEKTIAPKGNMESAQNTQADSPAEIETPAQPVQDTLPVAAVVPDEKQESADTVFKSPKLTDANMANELISVNFDQMDIRTVLKTIGDITGINFVIDDGVQGTVTVMSPTKIRVADLYEFLQSILEVKGYAAVPAGNLVKIVSRAEATKRNLTVRIGSNPSDIPENDTIVTQMLPLTHADAAEVSQIIKPLLSAGAQMSTYPRTNTIVITDTSSNIFHAARVIQQLDRMGAEEKVSVIYLSHASADVVSEQITQIMEKGKSPQAGGGKAASDSQLKISTDSRTNSLLVVANIKDTERIKSLAKQLDVERPRGSNNVHVKYLKNAQAKEAALSLTAALANLKISGAIGNASTQQVYVSADESTNALIITASAQDYEVINEIIEKLDVVRQSVLVEMLIVEISQDSLNEIGVDWATFDQAVQGGVRYFGATNLGVREGYAAGDLEGLVVGAWKKNGSNVTIGAIMNALEKTSGVNILSTPHLLTLNHHKAQFIVGENMPFVTQSRITDTEPQTPTVIKTFEYKDVGITLDITPHISQGGLVRLEIDSQFTKLIESVSAAAAAASLDTPTTAKRQVQTVVSMNDGSTVVIGGLIRDDKVTLHTKIPIVGDIPLIGSLFSFKKDQIQKTNLLMFITPHIVDSQQDLDRLTVEKKQQMNAAVKGIGGEKNNAGGK